MKDIHSLTDNATLQWLLDKENPAVRYFTQRDLLNMPAGDPTIVESRRAIMTTGPVREILEQQKEGGFWAEEGTFYAAKYSGTVWQLMILAELGADGADPRIARACEFILAHSQEKESYGFSYQRSIKEGGGLKSGVIPCLTGNMVWSLIRLGMLDDPRVQKGIEWICRYQRADDGTNHSLSGWPYNRYEMCWGRHSCHMGVVKSLKALSAIPSDKRSREVSIKIDELSEYLLRHHIHKKSHDLTRVSKPGWLKLGFPLMYQTDILEILDILSGLGIKDSRMKEALDILESKKTSDGRWKMENTFNGKMITNIEAKGNDSRWITFRALRVVMVREA